jgi:hypothetical protein
MTTAGFELPPSCRRVTTVIAYATTVAPVRSVAPVERISTNGRSPVIRSRQFLRGRLGGRGITNNRRWGFAALPAAGGHIAILSRRPRLSGRDDQPSGLGEALEAAIGVTEQVGAKRKDSGEARGHPSPVDIAGHNGIGQQAGYSFVEITRTRA